jgi:predicted CXXCH cytochrome family protein
MKKKSFLFLLIVILILQFNLSDAQMNAAAPKNPNSGKACAICHYRWIDTFFVEGRGSDLVDYTAEKRVATPDMCFSCHDGSIADSRARAFGTAQHKTNVPPPDHMPIPDIFPLDEQGKMQCATCHTAHAVASGPDSKETIFMRTSNRNSTMCRMCHPQMADSTNAHNHPLDTVKPKIPRRLIEKGALEGDKPNRLICETCHAAHGAKYENYLIESGRDSSLCLACHGDKNPLTPDGKKKSMHVVNVKPVTATIPDALQKQGAATGKNGELICLTCHKVHQNQSQQAALLITKDQKAAFCLNCHPDKKPISATTHNLQRSGPQEKNLQGDTVAQAGVCSACHLPHQAARPISGPGNFTTQLCVSCHSKGNIAAKASLTGVQHPLAVRPKNKSTLPLFNNFGMRDPNGVIICTTCHDPHRSTAKPATGQAEAAHPTRQLFLRQPLQQICAECHRDKSYIANSKHDLSKTAPETRNIRNQTPLQSGVCGSCHLVHNAQPNFLWARKTSPGSGGALRDLCLNCHSDTGPARQKVIRNYSHPVGVAPSETGLTTTLPLFDRNGKISEKGMLACPTCHDPHRWDPLNASDRAHYQIEGDSQNSFLRLENSPAARLCADCHVGQAQVKGTDHDLMAAAPASRNIIGQTPRESGTCGVCHLAHNSPNQLKLWAREITGSDGVMETMCNSCHSKTGSAKAKIPPVASHPAGKLITNVGRNMKGASNYFPLYDAKTGNPTAVGNLSCPSCHNAHQWSAGPPSGGSGPRADGSAGDRFLRARSRDLPCRDCHGPEALYKYLYFHDPGRRTVKKELGEFWFE